MAQLEELLAKLDVRGRVRLAGSSFGAVVASEFTLRHPARVESLVLVGPAGFPLETTPLARLRETPVLGAVITALFGRRAFLAQNRKYFADGEPPAGFWAYVEDLSRASGTLDSVLATLRDAPVERYAPSYARLARTGVPVRAIWGRLDATFRYSNAVVLRAALPSARISTIEGVAHLPQMEATAEFNALLVDALEARAGATR